MAMGKAVVSTRVGAEGLPVTHGENVLLVDDPKEFAGAIVSLLGDADLRKKLGTAARQLVEQNFGNTAVAKVCHDILERVVLRWPLRGMAPNPEAPPKWQFDGVTQA